MPTLAPQLSAKETAILRAELLPITHHCPVLHPRPADCPLAGLEETPLRRRRAFLSALNGSQLQYLATYCHICGFNTCCRH